MREERGGSDGIGEERRGGVGEDTKEEEQREQMGERGGERRIT